MANQVKLSIILPAQTYLEEEVSSVIIPAVRSDIDILPERAPSVFVLDYGLVQVLGSGGQVKARYFIQSGMADVAENRCKVMTTGLVPFDDITPHDAKLKLDSAPNENERLFYQMILDHLRGIRRRYLRTLNVFNDKSARSQTHEERMQTIRDEIAKLRKNHPKTEE